MKNLNKIEILNLLTNKKNQDELFQKAYQTKLKNLGAFTYLRALIEYSNFCTNDCFYCGIRASNKNIKRFEISLQQVKKILQQIFKQRYASFVIQSGERSDQNFVENINNIIKYAKNLSPNTRIVLSTGEQKKETYQKWFDSGADRYLLRIETSNPTLYKRIHPPKMSYQNRLNCLYNLKDIGYQTGTGILIGFPGQTLESIAQDILFFQKFDVDMLGMGPYIPHKDTPLWNFSSQTDTKENLSITLKVIAICRILLPDINIVASTALQTIDPDGYIKGIKAGANVLMPNLTPNFYKKDYSLYENKAFVDDSHILNIAEILNETITPKLAGDPQHFTKRKNGEI